MIVLAVLLSPFILNLHRVYELQVIQKQLEDQGYNRTGGIEPSYFKHGLLFFLHSGDELNRFAKKEGAVNSEFQFFTWDPGSRETTHMRVRLTLSGRQNLFETQKHFQCEDKSDYPRNAFYKDNRSVVSGSPHLSNGIRVKGCFSEELVRHLEKLKPLDPHLFRNIRSGFWFPAQGTTTASFPFETAKDFQADLDGLLYLYRELTQ